MSSKKDLVEMNKKKEFFDASFSCPSCGRQLTKRGSTLLAGIKCRTFECVHCGDGIVHPEDAQRALDANKLRAGIRLKVGELNRAPYVRFTKEFSAVLHKGAQAIASLVSPDEIRLKIVRR